MKIKSVAGRDLPVTTRESGRRIAITVKPGEIIELPVPEGIALVKSGPFVPGNDEAKKLIEATLPMTEAVKVKRRGQEAQVSAEIEKGKAAGK